jgi:hypothetical protein
MAPNHSARKQLFQLVWHVDEFAESRDRAVSNSEATA